MNSAAIILGGGGLKGAVQPAALEMLVPALARHGIPIDVITGVSVGGLIGGKLAEAQTQPELMKKIRQVLEIFDMIQHKGPEAIFPLSKLKLLTHLTKRAVLDGQTLRGLVDGTLFGMEGILPDKIYTSPIKFSVLVQNKQTRRQEVFQKDDPRIKSGSVLQDVLVATASLFPFFPPVTIEGVPYADGEHINFGPAIDEGCDIIFVLSPYRETIADPIPDDFVAKNFPIIPETFASASARIKDRDRMEISRAKDIAHNLQQFRQHAERIRGIFSRWPWTWRPLCHVRERVEKSFAETHFTFENKRELQVVEVYIEEQPPTLFMHTFDKTKRDIWRVQDGMRITMKNVVRDLGLV